MECAFGHLEASWGCLRTCVSASEFSMPQSVVSVCYTISEAREALLPELLPVEAEQLSAPTDAVPANSQTEASSLVLCK